MKVRVEIAPPRRGGATSVIFGTTFVVTSPSPISAPAFSRRLRAAP